MAFPTAHELRWNEFLIPAMKLRKSCSEIVNLLKQPVLGPTSIWSSCPSSATFVFAAPWPKPPAGTQL